MLLLGLPVATALVGVVLKLHGFSLSWGWVLLPLIGLAVGMAGVMGIMGQAIPKGPLGHGWMLMTFLAVPLTTLASIVKLARAL